MRKKKKGRGERKQEKRGGCEKGTGNGRKMKGESQKKIQKKRNWIKKRRETREDK